MNKIETGGPAFPCDWDYIGSSREAANGMTLRDYFAAKALQGLLAQSGGNAIGSDYGLGAVWAYQMADAMLESRKS